MKKILFISILLVPFLGFSQTTKPIDGFLGVKFGSDEETVKAVIKEKGGVLNIKASTAGCLEFRNVNLCHSSGALAVKFFNNKAFEANFIFDPGLDAKTIEYYYSLRNDLNDIYGTGTPYKKFKAPYENGDGFEITAIKSGNADYHILWASEDNSICETITTDLAVILTYQNGPLVQEAISKQ